MIEVNIDPTQPPEGDAPTETTRQNFAGGRDAINALLELAASGRIGIFPGSLPEGWVLADGRELSRSTYSGLYAVIGTTFGEGNGATTFNVPNLVDRVIVGAGDEYAEGDTGGLAEVILTLAQLPPHDHGGESGFGGGHDHDGASSTDGSHNHSLTASSNGSHSHGGYTAYAGSHTHTVDFQSITSTASFGWNMRNGTSSGTTSVTSESSGSHSHTASVSTNGDHSHDGTTNSSGTHSHDLDTDGEHSHTLTSAGGGEAHNNLPPFLALNFAIKT